MNAADILHQGLEKKIPNQPENVTPVELRTKQIFADRQLVPQMGKPFIPGKEDGEQKKMKA